MSDRKLLKKVRDGDKEALSDIIKQYYAGTKKIPMILRRKLS